MRRKNDKERNKAIRHDDMLRAKQTETNSTEEETQSAQLRPRRKKYAQQPAYVDWLDAAIKEHEQKGGFDNLPFKGQKLSEDTVKGDLLSNTLKNANVLPPWLELQHEIRDDIGQLVQHMERSPDVAHLEKRFEDINRKIKRYNMMCPGSFMHKSTINADNIRGQHKKWT
jgi:hypothetical protein